jgi:hypothetical protein
MGVTNPTLYLAISSVSNGIFVATVGIDMLVQRLEFREHGTSTTVQKCLSVSMIKTCHQSIEQGSEVLTIAYPS